MPTVMRRALAATLAGLLSAATVAAQSVIRGRVVSSADGTPIAAAEVNAVQSGLRTRTDDLGGFRLLAGDGDSLRVRALGFREQHVIARRELAIRLAALPTTLARVITTAGQREMRSSESPASVTILDRADIAAVGAVSANQLLRQLPGLQELSSPPARTSISIRGLDQSRVLVLVDGEPVPSALSDNRDIGRLSTLAAERIEVTKGPSSVEFGSEALGGVINLVTAAPTERLTVDLTGRGGGLGRRESSAEVSNTLGPVGVRLSGGWRQTDRVTAIAATNSTLDRVYDFRGDTRIRLSERVQLRGDVSVAQQRQRWPVGAGFNGFIDNSSQQGFAEAITRVAGGQLRVRAFGQRYFYQFREALGLLPIAGSADSLEQREQLARGLVAYSTTTGRHTIDAGVQLSARGLVAPRKLEGDRLNDRMAEVYFRDAITVGSLLLSAGGRSTSSTLWGTAFAPSVGAVWQAAPAWRVRSTVARGFRGPSFKELRYTFLNGAAGYTLIGNPDLRPESSWSTSLGTSWSPAATWTLNLETYRNEVRDLIATRNTGTNAAGLLQYENVNVARARTEGVEAGAEWRRGADAFTIGYDYLRARDLSTGRTLDGRATHTARLTATRRWDRLRNAITDLTTRYTGSAPLGEETQGAFLSIDAQLRIPVVRTFEFSAAVNNLLDQQPMGWTPAFRRQFLLGARARWSE